MCLNYCSSISACCTNSFSLRVSLKKKKKKNTHTETLMPHISKCEFSQPDGMGVDVTQKRNVVLIWNLAQIGLCRKTYSTESWVFFFFFFLFCFQIWITPQNYLIGQLSAAMVTVRKIRLMIVWGKSICIYPSNMSRRTVTVIELDRHPCLANQRPCMVTMATRWK